jgi:hypothetical protein
VTDHAPLLCPQCDATTWHPTEYLKGAAHLCYLWCSPCAAREQDEFLAMVSAADVRVTPGAGSATALANPSASSDAASVQNHLGAAIADAAPPRAGSRA